MGAPLLHVGMAAICPHGGQVQAVASAPRVKVQGQPVLLRSDPASVAGCPFLIPSAVPTPGPCVSVQWLTAALRVRVSGQPVLLQNSQGLATGPAPGPVTVVNAQARVRGT